MSNEQVPAYLAICCKCGKANMMVVDDGKHPKDTAKTVAESVRRGDAVTRTTVGACRTAPLCDCRARREEARKAAALAAKANETGPLFAAPKEQR